MLELLRTVSLRRFAEHRLRTAMTALGVALGVAVLVAVVATNKSILASLRDTLGHVSGKVHLEVKGGDTGLPEDTLDRVRGLPEVAHAAVAIQRTLDLATRADSQMAGPDDGETLAILAVNFTEDPEVLRAVYGLARDQIGQRDKGPVAAAPTADDFDNPLEMLDRPRQVIVSDKLAGRLGKRKGDTVALMTRDGEQPFTIYAVTPATGPQKAFGGNLAVMDYLDAQEVFGLEGRVDRIDVVLRDAESAGALDRAARAIAAALGGKYEVESPSARAGRQQQVLRTFSISLTVGAGVALMVGMFLIYHTMSISVAQRRSEIGVLRATGATRGQVVALFTLEGAVYGVVGSGLGIGLGLGLARLMMQQAAASLSDIYVRVHTSEVTIDAATLTLAVVGGLCSATVAALWPAWRASSLSAVETIRTTAYDPHGAPDLRWTRREWAGLGSLALVPLAAGGPVVFGFPWFGFVAMFFVLLGATLLGRWCVVALQHGTTGLASALFGIEGRLAADNLGRGASKAAVTVAALMVGLSMVIASSTLTHSFVQSIDRWVEQAVPADLFVTSNARLGGIKNQPLKPELGDQIAGISGVLGVDKVRLRNIDYRNTQILLLSVDVRLRFALKSTSWEFSSWTGDRATLVRRLQAGEGVLISETLAHRFGIAPGGTVQLQTAAGRVDFPVLAAIVDYSSDQGAVFIDRNLYLRHWQDDLVDTFEPYLDAKTTPEAVRAEIVRRFGRSHRLFVLTNAEFRVEIKRMIDQLFSVMRALELVTILISLLSVVNTLLTSILDRTREIGVLRAIGMVRGQLGRMILVESLLLGVVGAIIGTLVGAANGYLMLEVISKQDNGWQLPMRVDVPVAAAYCAALVGVAVLAGVYPARVAGRLRVVEALGYE
ncbi:MAG: ABC transporter permease [Deltaproteobacteria bacterium]|nr:ABC transporter permease [Deltaproteobacteria bacterium]